jgi:hypothetical protein
MHNSDEHAQLGERLQQWPNRSLQRAALRFGVGGATLALGLLVDGLDVIGFYGVFVLLFAVGSLPFLLRDARLRVVLHEEGLRIVQGKREDVLPYADMLSVERSDGRGGDMERFEGAAIGLLVLVLTFELKRPVLAIEMADGDIYTLRGAVLPDINGLYWRIREGMGEGDVTPASAEMLNHPSFDGE